MFCEGRTLRRVRLIFAAVLLAASCSSNTSALSVDAPDPGSGHHDGAAGAGGSSNAADASGSAGSGPSAGANGADAGGRGGSSNGGAGGRGGDGVGAATAPACAHELQDFDATCPRILDPNNPGNPNDGWQCAISCVDSTGGHPVGCVFYTVTYCVASCADCRP